jgi:hypothetical protein
MSQRLRRTQWYSRVLTIALALVAFEAYAVAPPGVNFQGLALDPSGSPINGTENVLLRIYVDPVSTAPADLVYEEAHLNADFIDGVFSVVIGQGDFPSGPFDAGVFRSPDLWLEVEIAGEILTPRTKFQSVAYALQCANSDTLGGFEAADLQRRVTGVCPPGEAIRQINANGTVDCEPDDTGGDITAVNAGAGLDGGGVTGDVDLFVDFSATQARVFDSCPPGSSIRVINSDGSVACEADTDTNSGGDITAVNAGTSLTGGGVTGNVTLSVATGGITATQLATNSVGAAEIAAGAVGTSEVADNSLTANDLAPNSVNVSEIAAGAVRSSEVFDNSLTANDLAAGSVGTSEIATGGVTNSDIANGAVSINKISGPGGTTIPTAYGRIGADGSIVAASSNVTSVTFNASLDRYEVTISGVNFFIGDDIATVNAISSSPRMITYGSISGRMTVYVYNVAGIKIQNSFSFVVWDNI